MCLRIILYAYSVAAIVISNALQNY